MAIANRHADHRADHSLAENQPHLSTSQRTVELEEALDNFERVHMEWVEAVNRDDPDTTYWEGVEMLIDTFNNGDMPRSMRQMDEHVQQLSAELTAFDNRDDQEDQMPGDDFFAAVEAIFKARKAKEIAAQPRRIESIKELDKQKVTHEQIARMYGWVDQNNRPQAWKVQEELDTPGKHVNDSWIHPDEKKQREKQEAFERRREDSVTTRVRAKTKRAPTVCPETCFELWQQGVSARQAATMLLRSKEEVELEYRDFEEEKEERERTKLAGGTVGEVGQGSGSNGDSAPAAKSRIEELTGGRVRNSRRGNSGNGQPNVDHGVNDETDAQADVSQV